MNEVTVEVGNRGEVQASDFGTQILFGQLDGGLKWEIQCSIRAVPFFEILVIRSPAKKIGINCPGVFVMLIMYNHSHSEDGAFPAYVLLDFCRSTSIYFCGGRWMYLTWQLLQL